MCILDIDTLKRGVSKQTYIDKKVRQKTKKKLINDWPDKCGAKDIEIIIMNDFKPRKSENECL